MNEFKLSLMISILYRSITLDERIFKLITHVTQLRAAEKAQIVTSVIPEMLAARPPNTTELSTGNGSC